MEFATGDAYIFIRCHHRSLFGQTARIFTERGAVLRRKQRLLLLIIAEAGQRLFSGIRKAVPWSIHQLHPYSIGSQTSQVIEHLWHGIKIIKPEDMILSGGDVFNDKRCVGKNVLFTFHMFFMWCVLLIFCDLASPKEIFHPILTPQPFLGYHFWDDSKEMLVLSKVQLIISAIVLGSLKPQMLENAGWDVLPIS